MTVTQTKAELHKILKVLDSFDETDIVESQSDGTYLILHAGRDKHIPFMQWDDQNQLL